MRKLPVLLALAAIWLIFGLLNENFLSARNLTNLVLQIASMGTLSVALVLILLLGEIDLSIGAVSGLAAAIMGVLHVQHGFPLIASAAVALLAGAVVSGAQGAWFVFFKVPSFVVTLAGLLAVQGALLQVLGTTGALNLFDEGLLSLTGTFFSGGVGFALAATIVLVLGYGDFITAKRVLAPAGLAKWRAYQRSLMGAAVALTAAFLFSEGRGVPLALLILLGIVVVFDFGVRRTRFGRHLLAVGGNSEAARRAGIRVERVKVGVFALAGALAAFGGILAASRLQAVNQSSGSGDLLLNAIAAAVIGGTSLFGGRGSVWSAVTGSLVIGSISNGMDLLALPASVKFIVTGVALLLAVTLDASSRGRGLSDGTSVRK